MGRGRGAEHGARLVPAQLGEELLLLVPHHILQVAEGSKIVSSQVDNRDAAAYLRLVYMMSWLGAGAGGGAGTLTRLREEPWAWSRSLDTAARADWRLLAAKHQFQGTLLPTNTFTCL